MLEVFDSDQDGSVDFKDFWKAQLHFRALVTTWFPLVSGTHLPSDGSTAMSDGRSRADNLRCFLQRRFAEAWPGLPGHRPLALALAAERVAGETLSEREARQQFRLVGMTLAQEIRERRPDWVLSAPEEDLPGLLQGLLQQKSARKDAFASLDEIHRRLRERREVRLTDEELETYRQCAPIVGSKDWSKATVSWILDELQSPGMPPWTELCLLDVGSSYGAFCGRGMRVVALDLAPAHPEVLPGDFLQLDVAEAKELHSLDASGRLKSLKAAGFHAVVMSLVLSFLPTPELRRAMLDKARQCLCVGGALLLVEKTSLAPTGPTGAAQRRRFEEALTAAGFELRRYAAVGHLEGDKGHPHAHAWHLKRAEVQLRSEPLPCFKEDEIPEDDAKQEPERKRKRVQHISVACPLLSLSISTMILRPLVSMATLMTIVSGARPARSRHENELSDLVVGNETQKDCRTEKLDTLLPAFYKFYRNQDKVPGHCKRTCIDKSDLKTTMASSTFSSLVHGAVLSDPGTAPLKALIMGGIYASGAIPNQLQQSFCTQIVSSIVISCPRYQGKGGDCPLDSSDKNPYCKDAFAAGLKGRDGGEAEFNCAVQGWWDACCKVRDVPADFRDDECTNCGQDMYFCSGMEGCYEPGAITTGAVLARRKSLFRKGCRQLKEVQDPMLAQAVRVSQQDAYRYAITVSRTECLTCAVPGDVTCRKPFLCIRRSELEQRIQEMQSLRVRELRAQLESLGLSTRGRVDRESLVELLETEGRRVLSTGHSEEEGTDAEESPVPESAKPEELPLEVQQKLEELRALKARDLRKQMIALGLNCEGRVDKESLLELLEDQGADAILHPPKKEENKQKKNPFKDKKMKKPPVAAQPKEAAIAQVSMSLAVRGDLAKLHLPMVLPWKDLDARLDDIYQRSVGDLDEASSDEGETEEDEGRKAARQEKTGCIIEDVAERAITVKQLRSLRTFLQYLTKTELLKHTTEHSKGKGSHGKLIPWTSLNMYHITNEVIKKVIPHVDPKGEHLDEDRRWYSWVEFVAEEPQPAKIMFSHWWGGRFMDFMQAVDKMTMDRALSIYTPIWICTFANCQFGENFGSKLMDCPFIRTLKTVDLTVLVVDYQAGSLTRTWCGLEVHYTTNNDIDFVLYTSAGRVGSTYVSGGPLVEAVKTWDIRSSEASDPQYRRQILNYVAKVNELEGLKKDADGQMVLDKMGRPSLDGNAKDPSWPNRSNGEKEYAHEANLFKKHAKRFEDLNMMVRLRVMANLGLPKKAKGCEVAEMALRGVTLNQLRVFTAKLEASCPWHADDEDCPWFERLDVEFEGPVEFEHLRIEHVSEWVKEFTEERNCSYMELVADEPQKPQYAVTFSSSNFWHERMSAIELFAEAQHLPDSTIFFVEILGVNPHDDAEDPEVCWKSVKTEVEGIICQLSKTSELQEDETINLSIGPLIFEVGTDKGIYFASSDGVLACSQAFRSGNWVHGDFDVQVIYRLLKSLLSNTNEEEDEDGEVVESNNSYYRGLLRLHQWLAGPVLRRAARNDDVQAIKDICSLPGLRLSSDTMKDNVGRMPLHIAIACRSWSAMTALLEAKMDPNVEDDMKDRPLHYAALAGHAAAAKELVAAGADPWAENCFTENALEVARQSPAAFLGVNTSEVEKILKDATAGIPSKKALGLFRAFVRDQRRPSAAGSGARAARQLSHADS
ncbi:Samtor [Symbiodinium sp. CCMP2456]|nr:Samtor [Symbiodinium sp. CCMP2456]